MAENMEDAKKAPQPVRQEQAAPPKGEETAGKKGQEKQKEPSPKKPEEKIKVTKDQAERAKKKVIEINRGDEQALKALETLETSNEVYDDPKKLLELSLQFVKYVPSNPEIGAVNAAVAGRIAELIRENPQAVYELGSIIEKAEKAGIVREGTKEWFEEKQNKDQAIGDLLTPGLSGQMPPHQVEVLLDENDPRFTALQTSTKTAIRRLNNLLRTNFEAIDEELIISTRNEIAGVEGMDNNLRQELLERLIDWQLLSKETVKIETKVEEIRDFETRNNFEQLMNRVEVEIKKLPHQRTIRQVILDQVRAGVEVPEDLPRLLQVIAQLDNLVRAGGLNTEETTFLTEARRVFQKRREEIEEAVRAGRARGIDYDRYGYSPDEQRFIQNILFDPKKALEEIAKPDHSLEWFEAQVKKTFYKLYSKVNRFPRMPFQHSFINFYDQPVLERFETSLRSIVDFIRAHPDQVPDSLRRTWQTREYEAIRTGLNRELRSRDLTLDEKIEILREKMMHEFELTEYTHNVYYILLTRGKLEQLAGFSNKAHAVDLDVLFLGEKEVQQAYYFMIEEVRKQLTNNLWEIDPTFFAADPRTFSEHFEESCKKKLKEYYLMKDQEIENWKVDRAISMARGALLGLTGEILDTLALADAPKGDLFGIRGFFGDVVTGAINPMQTAYRFHPGKVSELFYSLIRYGGSHEMWDYHRLFELKKNYAKTTVIEGLTGRPIMDFMNLFSSGSVLARKGWRLNGATYHLIEGLDYGVGDDGRDVYDWTNVNPDTAWDNLKRAGLGIAFTWAKNLEDIDVSKLSDAQRDNVNALKERVTVENVLRETRARNPLKFLYDLDKSRAFQGSIREKVLQRLPEFQRRDFKTIAIRVNDVEDKLLLVQRVAIEENRGILESDFDVLQRTGVSANEIDLAKRYWRAITDVVVIGRQEGKPTVAGKKFKDPEYFFGSEDFNFEDLRFLEGGASLIGRIFGDANALSEASTNYVSKLEGTLIKASQSHSDDGLVELNTATRSVVQGIHGEGPAAKLSYIISTVNSRYFQKNWWARLPFGIGTILDTISGESSYSRFISGRLGWEWDEQQEAGYIAKEVAAGNIPTKTRALANPKELSFPNKKLVCDITLRDEVGARRKQIVFDVLRTVIPMIILLTILRAFSEETKSQQ